VRAVPAPVAARRARVAVAVLFAANGATLAGAVTRYPDIKAALGLSNTALGAAVGAYWVGALLVGAVAGVLVARLGSARVAWAATVLAGLALLVTGAAQTWLLLAAALFVAGGADAVADVAENAQALRAERLYGRSILNSLHAMWSVGAVTGGAVGAAPPRSRSRSSRTSAPWPRRWSWRRWPSPAGCCPATTTARCRRPRPPCPSSPLPCGPGPPGPRGSPGQHPRRPATARPDRTPVASSPGWRSRWSCSVPVSCAAQVMEDTGATWSAVYLRTELGAAAGLAGLGFVALQGAQTVGRLLADGLVTRWGDAACARVGAAVAGTAMAAALALADPVVTVVAFGVVGLGIGTIIPAAMRAADAVPGLRPGTGLTAVSTVLRAGGLVAAPLIGAVADATSLRLALGLVPLLALVVVLLAGALRGGHGGGQTKTAAVHRCSSA
jgi:MFS family permease